MTADTSRDNGNPPSSSKRKHTDSDEGAIHLKKGYHH